MSQSKITLTEQVLFYIAGLFIFMNSLNGQKKEDHKTLTGKWDWVYTKGNENGEKYHVTTESLGMSISYIFEKKNVKIFINNNLNEEYRFESIGDTLLYGKEKVLFRFSDSRDSLILSNSACCEDVFEKLFTRRK